MFVPFLRFHFHVISFQKSGGPADLGKLYEMGMEPERRPFLDKMLMFLEDKGTPVTSMPSISKQPLDLYKLYLCVKEKGGMVEVSAAQHCLLCVY